MESIEKNSVLIVDDEKSNLEVLISILSPEYKIYMTKSGAAAIDMANKYLPDIILLDIIMPDMNGFEVLAELNASEKTRNIPVIFITGLDSVEDEEKGFDLDAADFIHKPFSTKIVQSRVRNQIQIVNQIRAIEQYAHNMQITIAKMEAIINNYKGLIWSVDDKGIVTSFNGQYLKSIGLKPENMRGKTLEELRAKSRHADIVENVEKTFTEGPQEWISKIGGYVFRSRTTVMYDDEKCVMGVVGSMDDVTELVRLQQDLESALIAAEEANSTKSAFLARMSHEIRTPLNAILGISEIQIQNKSIAHDIREAFIRIFNSGDLLLGIINDILDMSKIEAGKLELTPTQYDVASLIYDTVFLNMIKYESKPIEFILNVDENVPAVLFGDELRIKQVLNNLLSNSFKYTNQGTVELSVSSEVKDNDIVTVFYRVRDTGQGMTEEQVGKLFDDYSRFNMEANRTTEGVGLGMSITRNLINLMDGKIFVESQYGKGSVFTIVLPQKSAGSKVLGKEIVEKLRQFRSNYEAKSKKSVIIREAIPFGSVLVVDDMEVNLYVAKGMLMPYNLQIDTAISGFEAIDKVKRNHYDLVFMDHMMPKMDGEETTAKIRQLGGKYEKLPIVALTANAVSGVKEKFLANGFSDFLSKPIVMQDLDDILKKWLSSKDIAEISSSEAQTHVKIQKDTQLNRANGNSQSGGFFENLSKIEEINLDVGLGRFAGNKDMYYSILDIFYREIIAECNNMTTLLEFNNLTDFAIAIHAMKSGLATVGALSLSDKAYALENAAKSLYRDFCEDRFPEFRQNLLSLQKKLAPLFPEHVSSPKEPGDFDRLRESLGKAYKAVKDFDNDAGMRAVKGLLSYDFGEDINILLEKIMTAFENYEFDEAYELLKQIE